MELFKLNLRREDDIITARTRARDVARRLGFESGDQVRIATAVSELTRNTLAGGGHGSIAFEVEGDTSPQLLVIRVIEHAGGASITEAMRAEAAAGAAVGVVGARRLMHHFDVMETRDGQVVTVKQVFPRGARLWYESDLRVLVKTMDQDMRRKPLSVLDEVKQQNRELAEALQQLEDRQKELSRLNAELFDTNRGVLALYAELDEKAEHLRNADQLKTRFLSNMSHEFRTPLNSILALTRLLNERVDGDLSIEQEKQVGYIRRSALELLELVNDLLDLAKVEAGKTVVRPAEFRVEELFSALRGMLRPLLIQQNVALVFEDAAHMPVLFSDEGKVSQILRNFLSNALKFTEHGEIRVSAEMRQTAEGLHAVLCVQDTGIGIAPQDHERIFEEFTQVEGPLQYHARGTGLGLPLCRKLAQLLGGRVWVQSELGAGSRFFLAVPPRYAEEAAEEEPTIQEASDERHPLVALLVEDRPEDRAVVEACLRNTPFTLVSTDRVSRARELLVARNPAVVVLDIALRGEDSWRFLPEAKRAGVPVVVASTADERAKGRALGADAWGVKPIGREWLRETLWHVVLRSRIKRVLLVDDDIAPRTLLKVMLTPHVGTVMEAGNGRQALELLDKEGADFMIVDLVMPVMGGIEMLQKLRETRAGALLPTIVCTSRELDARDRETLLSLDVAAISKSDLSHEVLCDAILRTLGRLSGADAMANRLDAGAA